MSPYSFSQTYNSSCRKITPAEKIFELSENERFDCILLADTLWLGDQHVALLDMINDIINEETGIIYLTYQHHNEHAPSFFELATTIPS